jgi:hypothetical protein
MDREANIRMRMGLCLTEMYELGKDDGYEEGWDEAKTHFRTPDL